MSADGSDDHDDDYKEIVDDDKDDDGTLSVVILSVMLDVLLEFIWDLGVGWLDIKNTSGQGVLLGSDDWKFSSTARFVLLLATQAPVYLIS